MEAEDAARLDALALEIGQIADKYMTPQDRWNGPYSGMGAAKRGVLEAVRELKERAPSLEEAQFETTNQVANEAHRAANLQPPKYRRETPVEKAAREAARKAEEGGQDNAVANEFIKRHPKPPPGVAR